MAFDRKLKRGGAPMPKYVIAYHSGKRFEVMLQPTTRREQ